MNIVGTLKRSKELRNKIGPIDVRMKNEDMCFSISSTKVRIYVKNVHDPINNPGGARYLTMKPNNGLKLAQDKHNYTLK